MCLKGAEFPADQGPQQFEPLEKNGFRIDYFFSSSFFLFLAFFFFLLFLFLLIQPERSFSNF
jgi:hypothetical protein